MRKLNATCDHHSCNNRFYRRPGTKHKNSYCSKRCYSLSVVTPKKPCENCSLPYQPKRSEQRFCCKRCAAIGSRLPWSTSTEGKYLTPVQSRLQKLKNEFGISCCMVEGCTYNTVFDIHRLVQGKDGGAYIVGNMFAICPNHHAEITRKIMIAIKINDYTLRLVESGQDGNAADC